MLHAGEKYALQGQSQIKFQALDALRGLAALAVAVFHFVDGWGGYLAVDFFLVLSGFVLSHSYLYRDALVSPAEFVSHRIARLYPLHLVTLLAFVATYYLTTRSLPAYSDGTLFTFIQNLTLTHNVGVNPNGLTFNFPSWSISVEFWVNILFIFFVGRATRSTVLLAISVMGLLVIYINTGHLDTTYSNYYGFINSGLIRGVSSFCLGILAYRIYLACRDREDLKEHLNLLEVLGLVCVLYVMLGRKGMHSNVDFAAPFLFVFVVLVFAFEEGHLSRWLKPLRYLGEISYSIYLNQIIVLILTLYLLGDHGLPAMALFLVFIGALMFVSHLTYQYIEKPSRIMGRDVFARLILRQRGAGAETRSPPPT